MEHVIATDLVRAIGESARMFFVARHQQEAGRVGGTARYDDDAAAVFIPLPVMFDDDFGDFPSAGVGFEFLNVGIGQQSHVGI